jgi:RNA-directed DNA polymerase
MDTHLSHVMVKGTNSPFDPSLKSYWRSRSKVRTSYSTASDTKIVAKQKYVCPVCSSNLYNKEFLERHHLVYLSNGGKDTPGNLMLLHAECLKKVHSLKWDLATLKRRLKVLNLANSTK